MVDLAKYDGLIQDLSTIESEIATLGHKVQDINERKSELEQEITKVRQENSYLHKKILELEKSLEISKDNEEGNVFNSINSKERETIKLKLQDLISKLDYHLSSDRQI